MYEHKLNGTLVDPSTHCIFCNRLPEGDEFYGSGPDVWDFTNTCPECWDANFAEPDEEDTDAESE